jgi:hypothetical protein
MTVMKFLPCDIMTILSDQRSDVYRRGAEVPLKVQIGVVHKEDRISLIELDGR